MDVQSLCGYSISTILVLIICKTNIFYIVGMKYATTVINFEKNKYVTINKK